MQERFLRIIDANYNRAREGLRVCEDILRFIVIEVEVALVLKNIRRTLGSLIRAFDAKALLKARDIEIDRAKFKFSNEKVKISARDLLARNFQRSTEALRVLEEISQILKPELKLKFMRLRFKVYKTEKDILTRI